MGQPGGRHGPSSVFGRKRTQGTETSQYLEEEKSSRDARSSGERNGSSPNRGPCGPGVVGPTDATGEASGSPLERGARDGDSPVGDSDGPVVVEFLSRAVESRSAA